MFRAKLLKALALGLCMSALFTGAAYAQSGGGTSSSFRGEISAEDKVLFDKQLEIDRYLFADHVKEVEKKGIQVNYTGVADTYVEIGISDYSDDKADYLYNIFGKDIVKVVAAEQAVLYNTMEEPKAAVSDIVDDGQIYTTMAIDPNTAVSDEDGSEALLEDKVNKGGEDEEFTIQIESINEEEDLADPEEIYQTTVADAGQEIAETVSAKDTVEDLKRTEDGADEGLSTPVTILLIAGGAVLVGGAIIISSKKKTDR